MNADRFIGQILDHCEDVMSAPEGYIARPEIMEGIRSLPFKDYIIFYTIQADTVRIERILHGSRDYRADDFE